MKNGRQILVEERVLYLFAVAIFISGLSVGLSIDHLRWKNNSNPPATTNNTNLKPRIIGFSPNGVPRVQPGPGWHIPIDPPTEDNVGLLVPHGLLGGWVTPIDKESKP